jgi:hypothetical protein
MATRRKNAAQEWAANELMALEAAQAAAADAEPEEPIEETPTDRVATLLSLATGDDRAYIACYRLSKGKMEWCKRYRPDEFEDGSFDLIRDDFGPGEYELRLYGTDPRTGKWAVRRRTRIEMADIPKRPDQAALPNGLSQVLTTIAQGQQQMLDALVQMKQTPQREPMDEMTKMLNMMSLMRDAMGLTQAQPSNKSSISEIVEAIKELRGAAAEVMPEKEEPGLMTMLPKVIELVAAGQQAQQAPQVMHANPMYQDGSNGVLSSVTMPPAFQSLQADQPNQDDDMNPMTAWKLRGYLKNLVAYAQRNAPIEEAAQYVYEKIPDELIDVMELASWFTVLSAVASEVKPHQEYLQKVRDAALALLSQDDKPVDLDNQARL